MNKQKAALLKGKSPQYLDKVADGFIARQKPKKNAAKLYRDKSLRSATKHSRSIQAKKSRKNWN